MSSTLESRPVAGSKEPEFRWRHGCGKAGSWTNRIAARRGGNGHATRCTATPIIPGFPYEVHAVAAGSDLSIVVQEGERVSEHHSDNWLLRDRDSGEGGQRLVERIQADGGRVVKAWHLLGLSSATPVSNGAASLQS